MTVYKEIGIEVNCNEIVMEVLRLKGTGVINISDTMKEHEYKYIDIE